MKIRNLRENDLELFYKYAREEQWDIEDTHIRALLKTNPNDFYIFYEETQPIAYVVALTESTQFGFISSLLVLKEFRGLGYGTTIFSFALKHLQSRQIALDSVLGQEKFYEKFGFKTYFDVNIYLFKVGRVTPKNTSLDVVSFDKELSLKGKSEYLKYLLLDKSIHYKSIKNHTDSFAFSSPFKDGYKITIQTQDINHAITLFFSLCQNYEEKSSIYIQSTLQEPILEALVQVLDMKKISHFTRMYNKILTCNKL